MQWYEGGKIIGKEISQITRERSGQLILETIVKTLAFTLCKRRSDPLMLIWRIIWSNMFLKDQSDITLEEWAWRACEYKAKNKSQNTPFYICCSVSLGKRCTSILSLDFPLLQMKQYVGTCICKINDPNFINHWTELHTWKDITKNLT